MKPPTWKIFRRLYHHPPPLKTKKFIKLRGFWACIGITLNQFIHQVSSSSKLSKTSIFMSMITGKFEYFTQTLIISKSIWLTDCNSVLIQPSIRWLVFSKTKTYCTILIVLYNHHLVRMAWSVPPLTRKNAVPLYFHSMHLTIDMKSINMGGNKNQVEPGYIIYDFFTR